MIYATFGQYCSLSCDGVSVQIQSRGYRAMVLSHAKMIEVDILCDDTCSSDTVRRDVWSVVCCMPENSVSFWCLETLDFTIAMYT